MTISYSGTVARILQAAAERLSRVFVCEARPLYEGRRLAKELHGAGIPVTLLTESQIGLGMPQVDFVLFGADTVFPGRGVLNKAGSVLLALAARHAQKPVLVATERLKFVRDGGSAEPRLESGPADEVWEQRPADLDVSNVCFEFIPLELVTELITD
jgi:translation initiation factor 2B subunit (eIF-2B alpha/beta/delta family)